MRPLIVLSALAGWAGTALSTSDGLTDAVTWDKYSLLVNGSRVFIKSVRCLLIGFRAKNGY